MPISPYVAQCGEYPFRLLYVEAGCPQPGDDWIRRFAPIPPRIEVVQLSAGPSRKSRTLQPFLPHVAIPVQPCADCVEYGIRRDLHALAGGLDKTVRSDVESYRPPALFAQTLRLETFQQVATTIPFSDLTVFVSLMHVQPPMVGTAEQHSAPMPRLLPANGAGGRLVFAKNGTPIVAARSFRTVIGGRQCLICGACRLHIPAASDHETRRMRLIHDLSQLMPVRTGYAVADVTLPIHAGLVGEQASAVPAHWTVAGTRRGRHPQGLHFEVFQGRPFSPIRPHGAARPPCPYAPR